MDSANNGTNDKLTAKDWLNLGVAIIDHAEGKANRNRERLLQELITDGGERERLGQWQPAGEDLERLKKLR